jgi:amidase
MKRRNFLQNAGIGSIAILPGISYLISCSPQEKQGANPDADTTEFQLQELTIDDLQEKMRSGQMTSRQITEAYLERIRQIDRSGPVLNSVIEINPDALTIADSLDQERKDGKVRGPLHGIPVLIKDNIDTGDKMMTTAGSLALEGHRAEVDAPIIKQLREAGAVLLGKTNLSEWANFRSTRSSSGWSSRGGQTKNPYVLDRSPCGSSSGSGTAVAANLCAVAIGTETNGSIACPASINGIVGIKPTVGLWSRTGIIPISHTQDTAGPMARTVRDAAILLGALTGEDPNDSVTLSRNVDIPKEYTAFLKTDGLQGKIIGVDKSLLKGHEAIDALLVKALGQIRNAGGTVVEVAFRDLLNDVGKDEFDVLKYEFKDGLNKYLAAHSANVKSLEDVIRFNDENEKDVMPYFKQEILVGSQAMEDLNSNGYTQALKRLLTTTRRAFADVFKEHKLNAVCGPTNGPSWCIDLINGDSFTGYGIYSPAAIAGYPSITVPMGMVSGLPIGLSFLGLAYSEPELISIAFAYEQVSGNRVPPEFVESVGRSNA